LAVRTKSTATDVVTSMDTAAERLITDGLAGARPGDAVLAEEGGPRPGGSGVRWIVDPIDGTVNYLYGIPQYAVSLAAEVAGRVEVGVVYDAAKDVLYRAVRGGGAFADGRPVHCSQPAELALSLIATGFGYEARRRARQAEVLRRVLPAVRDIRRQGAAALDLAAVACGQVDGFFERGLSAWDLAAGELIAVEAGAIVGGLAGRPAGPDLVIAAAPTVFAALHDLLSRAGADRD
jgi:myo-inositol-1(or 4)-monophosphatase